MSLLSGTNLDSRYVEPTQPILAFPLGTLSVVTPAVTPVGNLATLKEVKSFARAALDDTSEDDDFARFIRLATEKAQKLIAGWRQFLPATYSVPLACWWGGTIQMPRPPLLGVNSIKYVDQAGVLQTLNAAYYQVRTPQHQPGGIDRAPHQNWPSSAWPLARANQRWPITVEFQAGYPLGQVPETIKDAIIWYAAARWNIRISCAGEDNLDDTLESLLMADAWGSYSGNP